MQNPASRARRLARLPIARPLMLTVILALASCSSPDAGGTRASGATPGNLAPEQSEATMLKVADETRAGGDPGSAIGLYRRAHEMDLRDPVPLARAGETLAQLQAYTEAAEAYQAALALAPSDGDLHRGFGNVLLALGKPQLALAHLEIAAGQNPGDARVHNALGVAHDLAGRHDLAQQDYRRGLSLAPDQLSLRNNLGLSQALGGDYNGAIATLSDLVSRPGANARNRQNLALVYGLAGDTNHAASVARNDLDDAAVRNNLTYYTLLRNLDDVGRTAAILGADVRAARAAAQPVSTMKDPASAEAPAAAPRVPVATQPLSTSALGAPDAPASVAAAPPRVPERETRAPDTGPVTATPAETETPTSAPSMPAAESAPQPAQEIKAAASEHATPTQVASTAPVSLALAGAPSKAHRAETKDAIPVRVAPATMSNEPTDSAAASSVHKAAGVAGKRIVVQAGAFQSEANAYKLTKQLGAKGIASLTVIHDRDREGRDWYIVRTSEFATREGAEAVAQSIRDAGQSAAMVMRITALQGDMAAAVHD